MPANDKEAHVPIWFTLKIGGAEAAGFFKEATGFDSESEASEIKRSMVRRETPSCSAASLLVSSSRPDTAEESNSARQRVKHWHVLTLSDTSL